MKNHNGEKIGYTLSDSSVWDHGGDCEPSSEQVRHAQRVRGDDTQLTHAQWEHLATLVENGADVVAIKYATLSLYSYYAGLNYSFIDLGYAEQLLCTQRCCDLTSIKRAYFKRGPLLKNIA